MVNPTFIPFKWQQARLNPCIVFYGDIFFETNFVYPPVRKRGKGPVPRLGPAAHSGSLLAPWEPWVLRVGVPNRTPGGGGESLCILRAGPLPPGLSRHCHADHLRHTPSRSSHFYRGSLLWPSPRGELGLPHVGVGAACGRVTGQMFNVHVPWVYQALGTGL